MNQNQTKSKPADSEDQSGKGLSVQHLVSRLLTPTWKLRMLRQLHRADMEYDAAVNAYHEVQGEGESGFYEQNQANYWKGRRDALRMFLPNNELRHRDSG